MDDQNKSLNERWAEPGVTPERGYAADVPSTPRRDEDTSRRPEEIRSEIERTRADMTETIDAIQEKLRPANIVSQAKDTVRDATVGRVKSMAHSAREHLAGDRRDWSASGSNGVIDRIRENPVPAAIAAASIAWIAFSGRRSQKNMSPAIYGSTRDGEAFVRETVISEEIEDATELGPYSAGVGFDTSRVTRPVRESGARVRRATSDAGSRLQRFVRDNPLAAGAVAAAVGATVGMALPETRRENELMGEARDAVVTRAQEAARGAAEKVQDAAQRVGDVAGDAARTVTPDR
jgi:ElaB/YqjD/DUF883 family membrane-anchored ribosome-binding protein